MSYSDEYTTQTDKAWNLHPTRPHQLQNRLASPVGLEEREVFMALAIYPIRKHSFYTLSKTPSTLSHISSYITQNIYRNGNSL